MERQIYPYQFNDIKVHIAHLFSAYKSVNDLNTIASIKQMTKEQIYNTFYETDETIIYAVEKLMYMQISKEQVEKVFRKIKKLKAPFISNEVLLESTYIGWNDLASNRKFIIYYDAQGRFNGFYGDISHQTVKGFCAICNKESNVALFMRKTRTSSDGQYTKKEDYICYDSTKCNQQLSDITQFYRFINKIHA
ncbi:FusB/FusC family EF-G-binding protein [Staphylococcus nepalensis]|uniref:FusB/FusC family EF-G-binding protein n=1 Tax=Staphylococcus nepalensis TaxID=214473 RepID=UPI003F491396